MRLGKETLIMVWHGALPTMWRVSWLCNSFPSTPMAVDMERANERLQNMQKTLIRMEIAPSQSSVAN